MRERVYLEYSNQNQFIKIHFLNWSYKESNSSSRTQTAKRWVIDFIYYIFSMICYLRLILTDCLLYFYNLGTINKTHQKTIVVNVKLF